MPPSSLFRLVRENLMAQAVVDLVDARGRAIQRVRVLAGGAPKDCTTQSRIVARDARRCPHGHNVF